ncbi:MAG TPA: YcxB family protein [Segetibacter sp.]|jgi:hypothetical protein
MEIYFSYEKKLVIQALRYHFITRPEIKMLLILVNVFAIFSAALFYFKKVSPVAFMVSTFLWVGLMIAFWFIMPHAVYRKASTFQDTFKMIFGEHGIRLENERGFTEWDWNKFTNYFESPNFIHLYFNSRSFFLIPKIAAEEEGNINEIRVLLNNRINRK